MAIAFQSIYCFRGQVSWYERCQYLIAALSAHFTDLCTEICWKRYVVKVCDQLDDVSGRCLREVFLEDTTGFGRVPEILKEKGSRWPVGSYLKRDYLIKRDPASSTRP